MGVSDNDVVRLYEGHVIFFCLGCQSLHTVEAKRWHFNGDLIKPTLSPSVRHFIRHGNGSEETYCHYHIEAGIIKYCGDSPHKYANCNLPLPLIKEHYFE